MSLVIKTLTGVGHCQTSSTPVQESPTFMFEPDRQCMILSNTFRFRSSVERMPYVIFCRCGQPATYYSVCLVRWSGRRSSTASYVDVVHVILKRCVPLHPNLVQWLRQVPNHTMALRRHRRPYYGTFQRADFKGKTTI